MTDFKIIMTPQPPTPQRIAAALSLKELAPRKFEDALKNKNFVPFIEGVQRNWRIWLSRMKRAGYATLNSKKFGYARNCPPVLVSSAIEGAVGLNVRLVPCRLPACPFCHARSVMKVQKVLTAAVNNFQECSLKFVSYDVGNTTLKSCVEVLESFWDSINGPCMGSISKRVFWFESDKTSSTSTPFSYNGRLSFIHINPEGFCDKDTPLLAAHRQNYSASHEIKGQLKKDMGVIAHCIGKTFSYYPRTLYVGKTTEDALSGPEPDGDAEAQKFACMFNELHKNKSRFYRTAGICRQSHATSKTDRAATWRENFSEQLGTILTELSDIKEVLQQSKGNNDD